MYIGYENDSGHVYEGSSQPEFAVVPNPLLAQAMLIKSESDLCKMPSGINSDPSCWIFREDSFDSVTRIRRGRLYESTSTPQPMQYNTRGHPSGPPALAIGQGLRKSLYSYSPCRTIINMPLGGLGLKLAIGQDSSVSYWRVVQLERLVSEDVLVTLKALTAFGILPELNFNNIPSAFQQPLKNAIERVLNAAFREQPISVVDQCRDAACVLLSKWLESMGEQQSSVRHDLGQLINICRKNHSTRSVLVHAAELMSRFHSRGKTNEQVSRGLRLPVEEDAEMCVHAIGLMLREIEWAA